MPTGDKYELSDIEVKYRNDSLNNSTTAIESTKGRSRKMYISTAKAFILAFLAIAIAVGVGIIVHFAGKKDFPAYSKMTLSSERA